MSATAGTNVNNNNVSRSVFKMLRDEFDLENANLLEVLPRLVTRSMELVDKVKNLTHQVKKETVLNVVQRIVEFGGNQELQERIMNQTEFLVELVIETSRGAFNLQKTAKTRDLTDNPTQIAVEVYDDLFSLIQDGDWGEPATYVGNFMRLSANGMEVLEEYPELSGSQKAQILRVVMDNVLDDLPTLVEGVEEHHVQAMRDTYTGLNQTVDVLTDLTRGKIDINNAREAFNSLNTEANRRAFRDCLVCLGVLRN